MGSTVKLGETEKIGSRTQRLPLVNVDRAFPRDYYPRLFDISRCQSCPWIDNVKWVAIII